MSSRLWRVLLGIAGASFGIEAIVCLAQSRYFGAAWYFLPTLSAAFMIAIPPNQVVVRISRNSVSKTDGPSWTWRSEVGLAAGLTWFLVIPVAALLRHSFHHHHDVAAVLAIGIPALCSAALVLLMRLRVHGG
jgi:hypothetical protein